MSDKLILDLRDMDGMDDLDIMSYMKEKSNESWEWASSTVYSIIRREMKKKISDIKPIKKVIEKYTSDNIKEIKIIAREDCGDLFNGGSLAAVYKVFIPAINKKFPGVKVSLEIKKD